MLTEGSPARALGRAAELKTTPAAPAHVVSEYIAPAPTRHLPQMLMATTIVAVLPLASSLALRAWGVITSGWLSVAFAIALSLGASAAGSAYWRKHGAGEVVFGELLVWGWIRRWRQERELANATMVLQLANPGGDETLTVERREHLLRQLAGALEGQDVYLNGHSRRVARHATMIARGMGLPSEEVARIRAAAAVHDVGKLLTPKTILNKPGRLTDAEFEVIKRHPVDGAEMVDALGDPQLTGIVRHHHERLDGAGYPDRLRGEEIPLGARIIAVADTFDAITSARPYRDAAPHQKAIDILRKEAGAQLDPEAVRSFLAYYSGNRPTVVWALVTSSIRRLISWLTGDPAAAATISAGKVAAATAATAAIGVAAGAAPVPVVRPLRPVPVASVHRVAAPGRLRARPGQGPVHAPLPSTTGASTKAAHPSAAVRSRGGHARTAHAATIRRRRQASTRTTHGANHSSPAAGNPATVAATATGTPSANSNSSATSSTSAPSSTSSTSAPSSKTSTVPNSSAGGSASRPTSTNPAGHVNHASSTGSSNQSAHAPHPTPPGHSGSSNGNGNAGAQSSQGNGNGHDNGNGNGQQAASAPTSSQTGAGQQGAGNGQSNADSPGNANSHGNGNANSQGNGNANSQGNGAANSQGNANASSEETAGQGNGNGNGNGKGQGHA